MRLYASWEALPGSSYNWGGTDTQPSESTWKGRTAWFVDETGKLFQVEFGSAIDTAKLDYVYGTLAKPAAVRVARQDLVLAANAVPAIVEAAMRRTGFAVGAGGATVTLTPEA
ncbi:hypothetical protein [Methylobacterium sp. JK268]